jgi:hypothetical protein
MVAKQTSGILIQRAAHALYPAILIASGAGREAASQKLGRITPMAHAQEQHQFAQLIQ